MNKKIKNFNQIYNIPEPNLFIIINPFNIMHLIIFFLYNPSQFFSSFKLIIINFNNRNNLTDFS